MKLGGERHNDKIMSEITSLHWLPCAFLLNLLPIFCFKRFILPYCASFLSFCLAPPLPTLISCFLFTLLSASALYLLIHCSSLVWIATSHFRQGYHCAPAVVTYFPCSLLGIAPSVALFSPPTLASEIGPFDPVGMVWQTRLSVGLMLVRTPAFPLGACSTCTAVLLRLMNNAPNRITFYDVIVLSWRWLGVRRSDVGEWGGDTKHALFTRSCTYKHICITPEVPLC